jgi:DNA-binding MarR family transcriptional regulator
MEIWEEMSEQKFQEKDELLQQVIERMFSLIKQIHRDISSVEPFLSPPQARLIFIIDRCKDEGISVKELARIADITPGAITQFTDALIKKNLVRREEEQNDRRVIRLKLTSSARSHMEKFRQDFLGSVTQKFDVLSTDELKELLSLLSKVSPAHFIQGNLP